MRRTQGSQMKELKPMRSPHTSPSFPEAEAALLISLELAKKFLISTLKKCTCTIHHFTSFFPLLCPHTHRSSYFISPVLVFTEGISSVLQASQKLLWVGEMCELERSLASGDVQLHTTFPLSLLVYSVSLSALGVCLAGMTAEGVRRRGRTTVVSRLQNPLKV